MGSVSVTHNCMGSMPIMLVSLWVLVFWSYNFLGSYHFVGSVSFVLSILWILCHFLYFVISDTVHLSGVISHTFAYGLAVFSLVSSGMLALLVTHITHMISSHNL